MSHLVGGRVSEGSDFYTFESTIFKQSPFCMFSGLLFAPFCESCFVVFEKAENIVTYISIHTKQPIFLIQIATILPPFFVLPSLQVGKLTHRPMPLLLD